MNIEQARFNMIEQQIRPWKVLDPQVLDLLSSIPREKFVPEAYQGLAFADIAIPLGHNRFMLHPREEGRLVQDVKPNSNERVLVVGCGTGYVTALLASLAKKVIAIDSHEQLIEQAKQNLDSLNLKNVSFYCSDPVLGDKTHAPYDVIVVLGSMQVMCSELKDQLAVGGRLFCIIGKEPTMEALLLTQTSTDNWQEKALFETSTYELENAPEAEQFHF